MPKRKLPESFRSIVPRIACGKVSTYGRIAELACHPTLAGRSVGNILNQESIDGWHRVLRSRGDISPKLPDAVRARQKALLEAEGVKFKGWRIVGLAKHLWSPL